MSNKQEVFDREFRDLLTVLKNVLKAKSKTIRVGKTTNDPFLKYLNKYVKCYEDSCDDPDLHYEVIKGLYDKERINILAGVKNTDWLKDGVVLQFAKGVKGVDPEIKIKLSAIYTTALKLKDTAEQELDQRNATDEEYQECQELSYPDAIILRLYRLFAEVIANEKDIANLRKIIKTFEEELGIGDDTKIGLQESNSPFAAITGMANSLLGQLGGSGGQGLNVNKITGAVNSLMSNPQQMQSIANGLFSGMENCKDAKSFIDKMLDNMKNPELTNAVQETMGSLIGTPVEQVLPPTAKADDSGKTEEAEYDAD